MAISRRGFLKRVGAGTAALALGIRAGRARAQAQVAPKLVEHAFSASGDFHQDLQSLRKAVKDHAIDVLVVEEGKWAGHDRQLHGSKPLNRVLHEESRGFHSRNRKGFATYDLLKSALNVAEKDVEFTDPDNHHKLLHFAGAIEHGIPVGVVNNLNAPETAKDELLKEIARRGRTPKTADELRVLKLKPAD